MPINFSPKQLRVQGDRLAKDYASLEASIDQAWNSFVLKNRNLPPNLYQLRLDSFKLTNFPRTKNYDLFKTFHLLLILSKHSKYRLDNSRTYVLKVIRKAA